MRNGKVLKYIFTDVFAAGKYSGNQLATFLECGSLPVSVMQRIAREINFSETTFIDYDVSKDGGYGVRIFTPAREIDFAGHPTIGTAYSIREKIIQKKVPTVILNLNVGQIPVFFTDDDAGSTIWMDQLEPVFGNTLTAESIEEVLSLPSGAVDRNFPVRAVSTGLPHIIVPLKSLQYLRDAVIMKEAYSRLLAKTDIGCILIFCPEGRDETHAISVRMFAPYLGISEDPATGSGNGCLAAYLVMNNYFGTDMIDLAAGQGHEIGRPSLLHLRAKKVHHHSIKVSVGGSVLPVAEGNWHL